MDKLLCEYSVKIYGIDITKVIKIENLQFVLKFIVIDIGELLITNIVSIMHKTNRIVLRWFEI